MDDRKRAFDGASHDAQYANMSQQPNKRLRPEELISRDDPNKIISRLLLNRAQFSRIIGKGGQTIANIRQNSGVLIKGSDLDEDHRIVILTGLYDQVLTAFDMIVELLHQAAMSEFTNMMNSGMPVTQRSVDHIVVTLLLEHSKAGKAVGAKGAMMQTIKVKSNSTAIRIDKEPIDVNGVSLRRLTIEGTLSAIRRAHLLVQELYLENNVAPVNSNIGFGTFTQSNEMMPMKYYPPVPMEVQPPIPAPMVNPSVQFVNVPFPNLVSYGVLPETVRQLSEMKTYLWRNFGLDLTITREETGMQQMQPMMTPRMDSSYQPPKPPQAVARSVESVIESRRLANPSEVCFSIPSTAVGAVIGKGGQRLKDLLADYGVRVYVEKEDYIGKRLVVLSYVGMEGVPTSPEDAKRALHSCQHQITAVVEDLISGRPASNEPLHNEQSTDA